MPIAAKSGRASETEDSNFVFSEVYPGVNTGRYSFVYAFNEKDLFNSIVALSEAYNCEVDRWKRHGAKGNVDDFLDYSRIKWSEALKGRLQRFHHATVDKSKITLAAYRPFSSRAIYYDGLLLDRPGLFGTYGLHRTKDADAASIVISDRGFRAAQPSCLMVKGVVDYHFCATTDAHQCLPIYIYDEGGKNRRETITDWALTHFRENYNEKKITKWDIFYYVYGILHHPGYRTKFADNLKRELPRIPLAPDFKAFAKAGQKLAELHLNYEQLEPWPLKWSETEGVPLSYHVEKMRLSKDKTQLKVNESLTLGKIPPEVFEYRLGNRSALDWVIDQYQISTDKRSGITSDPNNPDDEQYIVRLAGQIVRVSVETVKIVNAFPVEYSNANK